MAAAKDVKHVFESRIAALWGNPPASWQYKGIQLNIPLHITEAKNLKDSAAKITDVVVTNECAKQLVDQKIKIDEKALQTALIGTKPVFRTDLKEYNDKRYKPKGVGLVYEWDHLFRYQTAEKAHLVAVAGETWAELCFFQAFAHEPSDPAHGVYSPYTVLLNDCLASWAVKGHHPYACVNK